MDPVLTDLHKLGRKCLMKATRHGVCVDESSACYVGCSRQRMRGRFAQTASWLNELANPELIAGYDESPNEKCVVMTLSSRCLPTERFCSRTCNHGPAVSSDMVFATDCDELVHHTIDATQFSLLRSPGFWSPLCLRRDIKVSRLRVSE